jgi:hypothetical protein
MSNKELAQQVLDSVREVTTLEDFHAAITTLLFCRQQAEHAKAARNAEVAPLRDQISAIEARYEHGDTFAEAEKLLRRELCLYVQKQVESSTQKRLEAAERGDQLALYAALSPIPVVQGVSFYQTLVPRVTDFTALPDRFKSVEVNTRAVNEAAKKENIPGVVVEPVTKIRVSGVDK